MVNRKIIGFSSFPDYSGNSKALFEDMRKKDYKCDFVWFCKNKEIAKRLNDLGIKAIWDKSDEFINEFKKTNIFINTHDDYLDLKNDNQIFIDLWHGLGPKKGGVLLENEIEWNYKFSTQNDFLVAPSEFGRFIFSTTFNTPYYRVKEFPQARYKWLFESNGKENLQKVLNKDIGVFNKIIMYSPTFKQGLGRTETSINKDNILNLIKYDEKVLINFLEDNNYLLVLKLHPSEENYIKDIKSNNIVLLKDDAMLENFITINEILNGIDLMISDYSSIYIDYINLEKPVIFFDTDKEEYKNNRGVLFNNTDFWWKAGPKVHTLDDFMHELKVLLSDNDYYSKERFYFNKLVNGNMKKSNEKLIEFIINLDNNKIIHTESYGEALLQKKNIQLENEIKELKEEKNKLNLSLIKTREELDSILYSRSYKIINKVRKLIKK